MQVLDFLMPIIAGHAEVDPDDRDEAVAVMHDPVTRLRRPHVPVLLGAGRLFGLLT